jgi:hypothetical protein
MQFQVGGHGVRAGCKYVPGISAAGPASAICVRVLLSCPYVHALACVRVCIMCIQCIVCVCCCCVCVCVCACVCMCVYVFVTLRWSSIVRLSSKYSGQLAVEIFHYQFNFIMLL